MKPFFRVMDIDDVLKLQTEFDVCGTEIVALAAAEGRILAINNGWLCGEGGFDFRSIGRQPRVFKGRGQNRNG